jgi:hypothetical protein
MPKGCRDDFNQHEAGALCFVCCLAPMLSRKIDLKSKNYQSGFSDSYDNSNM